MKQLLLLVTLVTTLFTLGLCQAPAPAPKKAAPTNKVVTAPPQVQQAKPQSPANELTVEQVVQLVQAGLSEDLVIARIRKNGKAFDLSTEQLLQLKKAGASDNIIRVLMDPQAQPVVTPAAPPLPPSAPPATVQTAPQLTPRSEPSLPLAQGPVVEETGFYLMEEGRPIQLAASSFSKQKVSGFGLMKMVGTMGISKAKQKAVLRGPSASVRTKNRRLEFFFYAPEGLSPTDYLALKLEKKSDAREAVVGTMGITGASGGFEDKNVLRFSGTKLASRRFTIRFEAELSPGEYCFYPASELKVAGESVNASGRLYDFGVE